MFSQTTQLPTTQIMLFGFVILTQLGLILRMFSVWSKQNSRSTKEFQDTVLKIDERHRADHSEWRKDSEKLQEKTNQVLTEFKEAIKEALDSKNEK